MAARRANERDDHTLSDLFDVRSPCAAERGDVLGLSNPFDLPEKSLLTFSLRSSGAIANAAAPLECQAAQSLRRRSWHQLLNDPDGLNTNLAVYLRRQTLRLIDAPPDGTFLAELRLLKLASMLAACLLETGLRITTLTRSPGDSSSIQDSGNSLPEMRQLRAGLESCGTSDGL